MKFLDFNLDEEDENGEVKPLVVVEPENQLDVFLRKREHLARVSKLLKADFVGLDAVIDRLIDNVEAWYLMPEAMTRPVIVCLWGMTGVGKTDLMRRFSKYLEFGDKYLEVQMTNNGVSGDSYNKTIQSRIEYSNLEPRTPGILLLDEIQRYRTKDERGVAVSGVQDQDIWQLLSDGKFASSLKILELTELLYSSVMWDYSARSYGMPEEEDEDDGTIAEDDSPVKAKKPKPNQKRTFNRGYTTAKKLKKLMKLEESIKTIMKWPEDEKEARIRAALESDDIFEGEDYSQLLIVISGNIDEAYAMSEDVSDADVDADVLHEFSKNINFLTIKRSLLQRFYPEQIARFGNNHIVYPALSKQSFKDVISLRLSGIKNLLFQTNQIEMTIEDEINNLIYRNGVFPSQGVRPVFSTIYAIVESFVPKIILHSLETNESNFRLTYSGDELVLRNSDGKVALSKEYLGDIDSIKSGTTKDERILVSVHEAGHALIYTKLFGIVPTQIEANPSADNAGGFVGLHNIVGTKKLYENRIATMLGGYEAERFMFGEVTSGSSEDLAKATSIAKSMVARYGMGPDISVAAAKGLDQGEKSFVDREDSEMKALIDEILETQKFLVEKILQEDRNLFIKIAKRLFDEETISPDDFLSMCLEAGIDAKIQEPRASICGTYFDLFEEKAHGILS